MDRLNNGPYRRHDEEAMSQHKYSTQSKDGKQVLVTLGYDRPLDFVFCTVTQEGPGTTEGEEILYSNLSDDEAGTDLQDVDFYRSVLDELGISVPDSMFTEVKIDQLGRIGNRLVRHS